MLVASLGTPASASTWVYNVVRAIMAHERPESRSLFAVDALDLLRNIDLDVRDVVVKAHSFDRSLLALCTLVSGRIILTRRDFRDSVVSQMQRFGISIKEAVIDISRSLASMTLLEGQCETLHLDYDDEFTNDPETVYRISEHIGLPISRELSHIICREFQRDQLKPRIEQWTAKIQSDQATWHHATHWHAGHIGDGVRGKWQGVLDDPTLAAVTECLAPLGNAQDWQTSPIWWSPILFNFCDGREPTDVEILHFSGQEEGLVFGPYLHLPLGRWRITPILRSSNGVQPVTAKVDVYTPSGNRGVLHMRTAILPNPNPERLALEFDNIDHLHPIELRISTVGDQRQGSAIFEGARVEWLGPSEMPWLRSATPVSIKI